MATVASEIEYHEETTQKETWQQEHERIAEKYSEIIENQIPPDILIQGVTIDFAIPSGGPLTIHGYRETDGIKESVFFFAAPSNVENAFKNLRKKFYQRLQKYAFVLGKGQGGRNLYLIPVENIEAFMETVDELKEAFKELEDNINAYLSGGTGEEEREYLRRVEEHLEKESNVFTKSLSYRVELNFYVSLMPLRIDSQTFMSFTDDEIRKRMEKALELLDEEFARTQERFIHEMLADLNKRFSDIVSRLAKALEEKSYVKYKSISRGIDEAMALAMSVNLHRSIEPLADAIKTTAKVLSKKEIEDTALKDAALKIASALKIESSDPGEILQKASYDLEGMSARAAELVRRM